MGDDYTGIFDKATVADFERPTSAHLEVTQPSVGRKAFDAFVDEQLRAVRTAWMASQTWMQPIVVLASPSRRRVFTADPDETLLQLVHRMHREALAMEATWLFLAKRSEVANLDTMREIALGHDGHVVDVNDPDAWEKAEAAGLVQLGVLWFAERREHGEVQIRHGQFGDEAGVLGEPHEAPPEQRMPLFEQILGEINP